jgi:large repetitive protein
MTVLLAAGPLLLGVVVTGPALAKTAPLTQLCSPSTNGGTVVNGVCVLPGAQVGLGYEAFIDTSNGAVNTFTVVSGSIPPGISLANNGTQGAILSGTPTQDGTFTFTVLAGSPKRQTAQETYSIAVTPAPPLTFLCSPATNGGTLAGGVCVLPHVNVGQNSEEFILTSNGAVNTFTVVAGSLPPGMSMPATFGAAGTIVGGAPTQQGTFTFTVRAVPFANPQGPSTRQAFSITVDPPLPLAIATTSPLPAGQAGVSYFPLDFFLVSTAPAPITWSVASGQLPPGLALSSPNAPAIIGNQLSGTPATAGTFVFTMKVTDALGRQATQQFSLTIQP